MTLSVEIEALAGVQFGSSQVVVRALRNLIHRDQETFIALHLNGRLKISALTVVSIGTISSSLVHPREVFRAAILAGATGIIGVHQHPSGDPAPSQEDRAITARLMGTDNSGELDGRRALKVALRYHGDRPGCWRSAYPSSVSKALGGIGFGSF